MDGEETVELRHERRATSVVNGREYVGEGVHEVRQEDVDELLASGAWERPGDSDSGADGADEAGTSQEGETDVSEQDAADTSTDAADWIARKWNAVKSDVEEGAVDARLDAVEEAERARDAGGRKSVLEAIDERRATLEESDEGGG